MTNHVPPADYPRFHLAFPVTDLARRFRAAGVKFVIEPHVRCAGEPGQQATMFLLDPFGSALEIKASADTGRLFATS